MPMIGGNEANLKLLPCDEFKVLHLASLACQYGIIIHIDGMPFGAVDPHEMLADYTPGMECENGRPA